MKKKLNNLALSMVEKGLIPDLFVRVGIRALLRKRLIDINSSECELADKNQMKMISVMNNSPIAMNTSSANEQHYEVLPEFYELVLGERFKYSCCFWDEDTNNLDTAEINALKITCKRAKLSDGQTVLDMGCGWGSLSLWIAENYPNSSVLSVSNSKTQKTFIENIAKSKNLTNINVITKDMKEFNTDKKFDRIVSLEMFEHMKNYKKLFNRVSTWLNNDGLFFMHIFCHKTVPYEFIDNGPNDWMSRHFFTGGIMPSDDLPLFFQDDLSIVKRWRWNGNHYAKTCNAWLKRMDSQESTIMPVLERVYGDNKKKWQQRWRIFFMSCSELFAFSGGNEWYVSHYLFKKDNK
tara:strand:- start:708 stop:1757 length:1050 start_codon:yes stop_codon:yes gene_type:complete